MTGRDVAPIAVGLGAGALGLWWFTRKANAAPAVSNAAQTPTTATPAPAPTPTTAAPTPASVPSWVMAAANAAMASQAPPAASTATAPAPTPAPAPVSSWIYPLPSWKGRAPVISNAFGADRDNGARKHAGADIMFKRTSLAELVAEFPPVAPHSVWHFMPPETPVLAAADGVLWSAGFGSKGGEVVIDHGAPWATEYLHLAKLYVPRESRRSRGIRIRAGQALGIVGADPAGGAAHLHFEIWKNGARAAAAINPAIILDRARVLDAPTVIGSESITPTATAAPVATDRAAVIAYLDPIFRQYGRGLPLAYLRALATAESGLTPTHPMGVLNITTVALKEYNAHNLAVAAGHLAQPQIATTVASWILREVIASYRKHHPNAPTLREDWASRDFVELLTAGWNAGYSEARGVGLVARYLTARGLPVTLDTVWQYAAAAGAVSWLSNPAKHAFARKVAAHYMQLRAAGVA